MTYNTTKMPDHICCPECKDDGKRILHTSIECELDALRGDRWTWHLMNHDDTSKFQWPDTFVSKQAAKAHLNSCLGEDLL